MKIAILDDYADAARTLKAYAKLVVVPLVREGSILALMITNSMIRSETETHSKVFKAAGSKVE